MVTAVTGLGNTLPPAGAEKPLLSDFAQATLDRLSQMHGAFDKSAEAIMRQTEAPSAAGMKGQESHLAQSVQSAAEAFRAAIQVQSQIMQFSMATSISQSLGNNLNSFLKGA